MLSLECSVTYVYRLVFCVLCSGFYILCTVLNFVSCFYIFWRVWLKVEGLRFSSRLLDSFELRQRARDFGFGVLLPRFYSSERIKGFKVRGLGPGMRIIENKRRDDFLFFWAASLSNFFVWRKVRKLLRKAAQFRRSVAKNLHRASFQSNFLVWLKDRKLPRKAAQQLSFPLSVLILNEPPASPKLRTFDPLIFQLWTK